MKIESSFGVFKYYVSTFFPRDRGGGGHKMQICLLIFKVNVMDIVSMKFHLNQVHDRVRNESQFKYYVSILGGLNVRGQANLLT